MRQGLFSLCWKGPAGIQRGGIVEGLAAPGSTKPRLATGRPPAPLAHGRLDEHHCYFACRRSAPLLSIFDSVVTRSGSDKSNGLFGGMLRTCRRSEICKAYEILTPPRENRIE